MCYSYFMTESTTSKATIVKVPFKYYEANFDGRYMRLDEIREFIAQFKEYYYEKKMENPNLASRKIINDFNTTIHPNKFHPYTQQFRRWRKRWDEEIISRLEGARVYLDSPEVKAIQTRDEQNNLLVPSEKELESGAKNLAGELMNDAMTMLKGDQQNEDLFEDEVLIKRRQYVLSVFNYVIRAVNAKDALNIKRNQEKRETAGFLMDLVRRSTAGGISENDMSLLKDSLPTKQHEQQAMADNN